MTERRLAHPRYWPSWLGIGLLYLLGRLPLPFLWVLGGLLGMVFYAVAKSRRHVASKNIACCFPDLSEQAINRMVKQHFRVVGVAAISIGINWGISKRRLKRLVRLQNASILEQAAGEGKNIILLAPHYVGLEIGGLRIAMEHLTVSMYQTIRNPVVDHVVKKGRGQFEVELVERNAPLRSLIKTIRSGRLFYYLPDQDAGRERGVFAPFCGVPASTVASIGRMATLAKAIVIPAHTCMKPFGRGYEVYLGEPLAGFPSGEDIVDATTINQAVEKTLHECPSQYFWVHKRFKTRPEGEPDFYK